MATELQPAQVAFVRRLLDGTPDPVRVIDRTGRVVLRNRAALDLPEEGLGHLCPPDRRGRDVSCPACQLDAVFRDGTTRRWHVIVGDARDPERKTYWEVTLCPVREDAGDLSAVVEILRDATVTLGLETFLIRAAENHEDEVRKRTLEAGRLLRQATTLSAELGELRDSQTEIVYRDRLVALGHIVAGLAHEIHTPLGAVLSSADLLERQLVRLGDARGLENLRSTAGVIADGARRIRGVVRSLQLFSRVDEAPRKEVDLHDGLESTLALLRYKMGEGVRVEKDWGDLPRVTCRADAINQVFLNLLDNAIQAVEGQGTIRVRTGRENDDAVVAIEDTGGGIPEEILPKIFDLGFSTRGYGRGSGIGLALSRRIVEEHGGSLRAEGRPGIGARFTVRLPVVPPDLR